MTYAVKFRDDALKEWLKLDKSVQQQFAKKLKKCSENPHIPSGTTAAWRLQIVVWQNMSFQSNHPE